MSHVNEIKEAISYLKKYRSVASDSNSTHLEFMAKIIRVANEAKEKAEGDRTEEEKVIYKTFFIMASEIDKSLQAIDDYNKSLDDYSKGYKLLMKLVGSNSNDNG
ncbi:TPA: hypothetical protein MG510_16530 [Klebsiella pneumoniae]|uniref:hypothetical protein n=1 Tax=Klebsiella pneumoniae complex TaxID=3390273 RepID=UPI001462C849|nr:MULTISPECIES: hypothetical protein [Klebsiella]MCQ0814402.1 hypothetical protein [Klebsiella pneumoniae]MDE4678730.1 hypothetical protein [Klebsiella variicola]MEC6347218.1 hypothetical protein [Klebsiella pneumoniae]QJK23474.1 hypothetical protein HJX28_16125 [Klebsiella pneumoniae]HBR2129044.1 hypothetical protein [Klebsiella variicola]